MSVTDLKRAAPKSRDGQSVAAIHKRLRSAILSGELAPGSSVSLLHLTSSFDAGRTPLREALRMLQSEGLVIAAPNRQVRIATLTAVDFEGISLARLALEAVAIRITVPILTSADFAALEGYMAQMEHYQRSGDPVGFRQPHRAFHRTLVAAAGPRVNAEIDELTDQSERYLLRFGVLGNGDERRAIHRAILDAAAAGNAELAADRIAIHHARTIALVFSVLDRDYDLSRLRTTIKAVAPGAEAALMVG